MEEVNSIDAVGPTTTTAGGWTARAFSAISARVPRTAAGWGAFPPETTAAGVSGGFPAAQQPLRQPGQPPQAHEKDQGPLFQPGQGIQIWGQPSVVSAVWAVTMWTPRLSWR